MNSLIFGRVPTFIGRLAGAAGLSGGGWTALRMTELIHLRHSAFRALMKEVDQVVALCQWVRDLLSRSEVPTEKITISRHGLPQRTETIDADPIPVTSIPLRIAFLGRMHRTKGADVLIRALRSLPKAIIELHLYGIVQADNTGTKYLQQLKKLAEDDPRIHFLPAIPSNCVVSLLRGYHLLAVPSRLLETGPLVVLESFAAGTPVIGSNLGGIAEMVEDEVNGFLVEVDSVEGWSRAIRRCYDDRTLLNKLRRGIRPPRGMEAVANEMLLLYEKTLSEASVHEIPSYFLKKVEAHS
jgi:glycosyltransferase involved in cell wall biosynthesis